MGALSEKNLIDELYSQDVTSVDSDIDSLIERQFSSFYQQYSDFSIITKFLSYRTKSYIKLLENFNSTSKIFPINLRYNLGLSKLINIKYTQFENIKLYEYITKRGSNELFFRLANNLGLGDLEQLILTNIEPVTIIGAKSKKKYGNQILANTITDVDLIDNSDIPVYLPIYSIIKDIDVNTYIKFKLTLIGLIFDKSEKLSSKYNDNTLEELILTFFIIESIRKEYTPVDQLHYDYYSTNLVLPTQLNSFKDLMYYKFPELTHLSRKEQWSAVFKPFITDYPKFTNLFRINTSNKKLNDLINQDIAAGDFITRLNLKYIDSNNVITNYKSSLTSALLVRDPDLFKIYVNIYYLHKNPIQYLKYNSNYRTLYGNILQYFENVELKEIFLVDSINLLETILKKMQQFPEYASTKIDNIESANYYYDLLKNEFINFRPMSITLVNPNIVSHYHTGIHVKSSMSKYPNLKEYSQISTITYIDKHHASLVSTKHSEIIYDIKIHSKYQTAIKTTIDLNNHIVFISKQYSAIHVITTDVHSFEISRQYSNINLDNKHSANLVYTENSDIDLVSDYSAKRDAPHSTQLALVDSAVTSKLNSHHESTIDYEHSHHATYYTNTKTQIVYQHSHTETSG